MANYVTNVITFTEDLNEKQLLFLQEIKRLGICQFLRPVPTEMYEAEDKGTLSEEQKATFIEKYGVGCSYDWAVQKWGTKSGDFQTHVDEGNITFESAWTQLSDEILDMFSVIFPNFNYWWQEEQGYGEEISYTNGIKTLVSEWDIPDTIAHYIEIGDSYCSTIFELLEPYKNNEVGFYEDIIDDGYFIGNTREEVEEYVFEKHDGKASIDWTED